MANWKLLTPEERTRKYTGLEIVLALKKLKCASATQVAMLIGLKKRWVQQKIKELQKRNPPLIYVSDYKRFHITGPEAKMYSLVVIGDEKDAARPILNHQRGNVWKIRK